MGEVRALRDVVESAARMVGFQEPEAVEVVLAIHEAIANVLAHGYSGSDGGPVTVRIRGEQDVLEVILVDASPPVPTEVLCPRAWDDAKPGGMGIPLMRKVMDVVEHRPRPGRGNVLRMLRRRRGNDRERREC